MSVRDQILAEMQARLDRAGNKSVRNPVNPPSPVDFPTTALITGPSNTTRISVTGEIPETVMDWVVSVVPYYVGSDGTDETAEAEFEDHLLKVINALYGKLEETDLGDANLGGYCHLLSVTRIGDLIKPYAAEPGIAAEVEFTVRHSLF